MDVNQEHYEVPWYIILYKMSLGFVEFVSGLILAFFGEQTAIWYRKTVSIELSEDPHDTLARLSQHIVPGVLNHHTYLVLYLLALGGAKLAGAVGLVFGRNWGVDLLVALTVAMFPFQMYDLVLHPSLVNFLYISAGVLIALYLIEWRPRIWARRMAVRAHHLVWRAATTSSSE